MGKGNLRARLVLGHESLWAHRLRFRVAGIGRTRMQAPRARVPIDEFAFHVVELVRWQASFSGGTLAMWRHAAVRPM
jgi:hypothetical protein